MRTLHRDLLLPCGFLSAAAEPETVKTHPNRRPRARQCSVVETEDKIPSDLDDVPDWTFRPLITSKPDVYVPVHETHKLSQPPCVVRQSAEPEVPTVSLPLDPPATESLVVEEGEGVFQDVAEHDNSPERDNSPESNILPASGGSRVLAGEKRV